MINTPAGWRQNSLGVFVGVCLPDVKSINGLNAKKQAWCGLQTGRNLLILAPKSFPLAGSYLIWMAFKTVSDGKRSHRRGDYFAVKWQIKYRTIRNFVWLNLKSIVTKKNNTTHSLHWVPFPLLLVLLLQDIHTIVTGNFWPVPPGEFRGYLSP